MSQRKLCDVTPNEPRLHMNPDRSTHWFEKNHVNPVSLTFICVNEPCSIWICLAWRCLVSPHLLYCPDVRSIQPASIGICQGKLWMDSRGKVHSETSNFDLHSGDTKWHCHKVISYTVKNASIYFELVEFLLFVWGGGEGASACTACFFTPRWRSVMLDQRIQACAPVHVLTLSFVWLLVALCCHTCVSWWTWDWVEWLSHTELMWVNPLLLQAGSCWTHLPCRRPHVVRNHCWEM